MPVQGRIPMLVYTADGTPVDEGAGGEKRREMKMKQTEGIYYAFVLFGHAI
jgi:hypothetical protein